MLYMDKRIYKLYNNVELIPSLSTIHLLLSVIFFLFMRLQPIVIFHILRYLYIEYTSAYSLTASYFVTIA